MSASDFSVLFDMVRDKIALSDEFQSKIYKSNTFDVSSLRIKIFLSLIFYLIMGDTTYHNLFFLTILFLFVWTVIQESHSHEINRYLVAQTARAAALELINERIDKEFERDVEWPVSDNKSKIPRHALVAELDFGFICLSLIQPNLYFRIGPWTLGPFQILKRPSPEPRQD